MSSTHQRAQSWFLDDEEAHTVRTDKAKREVVQIGRVARHKANSVRYRSVRISGIPRS